MVNSNLCLVRTVRRQVLNLYTERSQILLAPRYINKIILDGCDLGPIARSHRLKRNAMAGDWREVKAGGGSYKVIHNQMTHP